MFKSIISLLCFLSTVTAAAKDLVIPIHMDTVTYKLGLITSNSKPECPNTKYTVYQLKTKYEAMARDKAMLTSDRDGWVKNYFQLIRDCASPQAQQDLMDVTAMLAVHLYPELSYQDTIDHLAQISLQSGLTLKPASIEGIQSPEQCPHKTLLDKKTAAGPFRRTDQDLYGTCYVHSTVRAMDYLNYSTNRQEPLTSIAAAALHVNLDRQSGHIDVDAGNTNEVVNDLILHGGCPTNEIDQMVGKNLEFLMDAKTDLDRLLFYTMSGAEFTSMFNSMHPASQKILIRALGFGAQEQLEKNPLLLLNKLVEEIKNYQTNSATAPLAFNSFASYLFEKAYCHRKVTYPAVSQVVLVDAYNKTVLDQKWSESLSWAFAEAKTQPLLLSVCSQVLYNHNYQGRATPTGKSDCDSHSVLIVGQDYDVRTKQCTYEILNSWGNANNSYDPLYVADGNLGTVWLPLFQLVNASHWLETYLPRD